MTASHEFEDADNGDELVLAPDRTYEVAATFVQLSDGVPVFTHRVRLARLQFDANIEEGTVEVIDLEGPVDRRRGTVTTRPLPNNVLHPGDLCPSSFGGALANMVEALDDDSTCEAIDAGHGWVRCRACGEAVNLKGGRIPPHTIPGEPSADDLLEDVRSAQGQLRSLAKRLRDDRDRAVRAAKDAGISQSRIAEVAGISQPAVAKILHKETDPCES